MFKKIIAFFISLWHDAKTVINDYAEKAYPVMNAIKNAVNDPTINVVVALTPFFYDDLLLAFLKKYIPKALEALDLSKEITEAVTFDEQAELLVEYLRNSAPDLRDAIYQKLVTLIVKFNIEDDGIGGKFSQSDLDFIVQVGYNKWKEETKH